MERVDDDRERLDEACIAFDAGRLDKFAACRLCGLFRFEFEAELHRRGLTVYRTTLEEYEQGRRGGHPG